MEINAGLRNQIKLLKERIKKIDTSKHDPSEVSQLLQDLESLESRYEKERAKRIEKQKAKQEQPKEVEGKAEVEDDKVILPKDEFIKEHEHIDELLKPVEKEHQEQVEELKEVKEAAPAVISPKCAICGAEFKDHTSYQKHREEAHGAPREYQPMDRDVKKEVVKDVEQKLGPAIISEKEDSSALNKKIPFKLDQIVKPVRGGESLGKVMRHDSPEDLVFIMWTDGVLKDRDGFGGYYPQEVSAVEEKPVEAAIEEPKSEPNCPCYEDMSVYCPKCKSKKTSDLKTNYDALLKDLKEERETHYQQSNHKWVSRLDEKIQDLEKAIAEKFPSEKQSAQLDHHDPMGRGMGDLYILPNSPEEAKKIEDFLKSVDHGYKWTKADVEGSKWYGKSFIEVPFGMGLEPKMKEYFAGTPMHTKNVEEIMSSKQATAPLECENCHSPMSPLEESHLENLPNGEQKWNCNKKQADFNGVCDLCKGKLCERCKKCHECVKITGAETTHPSGTEKLVVIDQTPADSKASDCPEGHADRSEYQDELAMPQGQNRNLNSSKKQYDLVDKEGRKVMSIKSNEPLNKEQLSYIFSIESKKRPPLKAVLKNNVAFLKKGTEVIILDIKDKKDK